MEVDQNTPDFHENPKEPRGVFQSFFLNKTLVMET